MRKRITALLLALVCLIGFCPAKNAEAAQFTDISKHWAKDYITRAVSLGMFTGTSATTFSPDMTMTRAMYVTCLASYSGANVASYTTNHFKDVSSNAWYAHAVAWAYANGVAAGTSSNTFSPNQKITREQLAVLMVAFANYQKIVLPRVRSGKLFSDSSQTADFALDAVYTLYRSGMVDGTSSKKFSPKNGASRAECATILCAYADIRARKNTYNADEQVLLINHRGYNYVAPENTMPAFRLSKQYGYRYVETDVQFTKDGVPVLLHDGTINRTSNGSGNVSELTYEQLLTYDFSCKKSDYSGTRIATFEEFISYCKQNSLHPYIELKSTMTDAQIRLLLKLTKQYGMQYNVHWISFMQSNLLKVKNISANEFSDPYAPLCLVTNSASKSALKNAQNLKNGKNSVTLSVLHSNLTASDRAAILRNHISLCIWTTNTYENTLVQANTSAEAITTENITYGQLYAAQ